MTYIVLLLTTILVVCGTGSVFCEEPRELTIEDLAGADPQDHVILRDRKETDGVFCAETKESAEVMKEREELRKAFASLDNRGGGPVFFYWAHGDYTRLKLIIRSDKKDYVSGESVKVMFFLRNNSDHKIHVHDSLAVSSSHFYWKLLHSNYDEATMIPVMQEITERRKSVGYDNILIQRSPAIKLPPGEYQLGKDQLDDYFDLSKPDTYELTCFLATACFGQYFDPPLQSNTLTFRILEDGEKAENAEEGMNPPKGEEVFKQPKPPKSVFYVFDDDEPHTPWVRNDNGRLIAKPRKIIDISPEMYYREKPSVE